MFDKNKTIFILLVLASILVGTLSFVKVPVNASYQNISNADLQLTADQNNSSYPPLVLKNYSGTSSIQQFGVGLEGFSDSQLEKADEANAYWVRQDVFNWDEIEPNPPNGDTHTYYWDSVDEEWLQDASARGLKIIAIIKHTPDWAQKYQGYSCGPVNEDSLDDFADFVKAAVKRYKGYIKYWEIGNEPDVDPYAVGWVPNPEHPYEYGCWGSSDDYYGGTYYGKMLSKAYPAIKSEDSEAQVIIGGLLLDCDPDYIHPDPSTNYECNPKPSRFFEGILRHEDTGDGDSVLDGWKYFDIIAYHGFGHYTDNGRVKDADTAIPNWRHRGIVLGKAEFLREVMAEYNINKPIMNNEASLLFCDYVKYPNCPTPTQDFFQAQAEYVVWLNVRNIATDILGTLWFTLPGRGWADCALLDGSQQPRPSYESFQFMADELRNAEFIEQTNEEIATCADLRAYKFLKGGMQIWVMWTGDETDCDFTLPTGNLRVFDIYGNDITPPGEELTIRAPVYVEIPLEVYLPLVLKND